MAFWILPNIEYSVTREFQSQLFNRLTYAAVFLSIAVLTVINVAIVGYEPSVVLSSNFNETQTFWFHPFTSPPKPGTLCSRRVFNVGESIVTNASIFEWKIAAITRPNAGKSSVAYDGATLDNCDIVQLSSYGDLRTWTLGTTVYVACRGSDGLEVVASTTLTLSSLPGYQSPVFRDILSGEDDPVNANLMEIFTKSTYDIGSRGWSAYEGSNRTGAVAALFRADVEFCPVSVGIVNDKILPCAKEPPQINLSSVSVVLAGLDIMQEATSRPFFGTPFVLDDNMRPAILNVLHLTIAAVRIDLGNPSPNNLLTHPEVLNRTLVSTFPRTTLAPRMVSSLYTYLEEQSLLVGSAGGSALDPFHKPGPSVVQAVYICKVLKRKSVSNLLVTVFVATAGMFTSGWAVFIFIARYIADRNERVE